ncbi:MAG: hypothetical protein NXI32_18015 [bacterium]|nr:hypothetical protein [bacterium]
MPDYPDRDFMNVRRVLIALQIMLVLACPGLDVLVCSGCANTHRHESEACSSKQTVAEDQTRACCGHSHASESSQLLFMTLANAGESHPNAPEGHEHGPRTCLCEGGLLTSTCMSEKQASHAGKHAVCGRVCPAKLSIARMASTPGCGCSSSMARSLSGREIRERIASLLI